VAEACLRLDSGARNRLFSWTERAREPDRDLTAAEQAALAVWRLPAKETGAAAADEGEQA